MSALVVAVAIAVMLIGVVGTVVPLLPGLALVWAAGVGSWWLAGPGTAGWVAVALLTLLLVAGSAAKIVLPTRAGRARQVPRGSLAVGLAGSVVGFFVVPVVGFVLGGLLGVFGAEVRRTGDRDAAAENTMAMLRGFGLGVLIESAAGLAMIAVWVGTVVAAGVR
ncbi:MAG: DUF456 domain-containing protein [Nitriliruptorales bacterium]|nr:DUF456 domain-containing protein [Nitriliruptorales bacterium]